MTKSYKNISKSIKLRTWVSLGLIVILAPVVFAAAYGILGALGGSTATPAAYWNFDEGADNTCSGGTNDACDASGNGHDGTFGTSNPAWQTEDKCISGKCLYFDGSDDHIDVPNTSLVSTSAGTISMWFRLSTAQSDPNYFLFGHAATDSRLYLTTNSTGTLAYAGFGTNASWGSATTTPNQWRHAALTYSGTTASFYIDGKLVQSGSFSGLTNLDTTITIGGFASDQENFQGYLDEVKIFQTALTADQVKAEYTGGAAVLGTENADALSDGLVGYWPMDETSGNASDKSGNTLTLTNNNSATYVGGKFGNGGEFVPASSQYMSIMTAINGTKTISFWANPDSNTNNYIHLTASTYVTSSAGTLSAVGFTNPTIYINGVQTTSLVADSWQLVTITTDTAVNANAFEVGRANSNYFDGTIDEVRLYNRTLSPSEVGLLYSWAPGPVGYWKLDDKVAGDSQNLNDSSANGNNATTIDGSNNSGMNCQIAGKYGGGCLFDGTDDVADIGDVSVAEFGTGDFTLMGWVNHPNPSSASGNAIVGKRPTGGAGSVNGYSLQIHSGAVRFAIDNNNGDFVLYSAGTVTANKWHHVAVSVDRDNASGAVLFLDGVAVGTTNPTAVEQSLDNNSALAIGMNTTAGTGNFNGSIDDVRIYNYARTPSQIAEDMNAGQASATTLPPSIMHFSFDESSGEIAHDTSPAGGAVGTLGGSTAINEADDPVWKTASSCKKNGCMYFGGNDYIAVTGATPLGATNKTVTFWANPDGAITATLPIISNGTANWYAGFAATNQMLFSHSSSGNAQQTTYSTVANVSTGWHHYAYTMSVEGANVVVSEYKDTVLQRSLTHTTGLSTSVGSNWVIGAFTSATNYFSGHIDELTVYNAALTPEQLAVDYNFGSSLSFGATSNEATEVIDGAGSPPLVHWNFDEKVSGDAQTIADKSGNGRSLTTNDGNNNTGMNCTATGKYGSSCNFDGIDDYMSTANPSFDDFGTGDMTVSAWAKYSTTPSFTYILVDNKTAGTNNAGFNLQISSANQAYFRIANGSAQRSLTATTSALNDNKWHHIVAVLKRTATDDMYIYVDGALINSSLVGSSGWNITSASDLYVGAYGTSAGQSNMDGSLDDIKIWNYALTPAQVAYEYNRGGAAVHWKLDECQGTSANNAMGSGNDGTLTITGQSVGNCQTAGTAWGTGADGKFESSLYFDGNGDYISKTSPTGLNSGTQPRSIAAWIKPTDTATVKVPFVYGHCNAAGRAFGVYLDANETLNFWGCAGSDFSTSTTVPNGIWSHVAVSYDGTNVRVYLNGKQVGPTTARALVSNTSYIQVGGASLLDVSNYFFNGQIDDFRIYNYALSEAQIKKLVNGGASVRFGD